MSRVPPELRAYFDEYHQPEICGVLFDEEEVGDRPRDIPGLERKLRDLKARDRYPHAPFELARVCLDFNAPYREGLRITQELVGVVR